MTLRRKPRASFFKEFFQDNLFMVVFFILTAKLVFFTHMTEKSFLMITFLPSLGEIFVLLSFALFIRRPGLRLMYLSAVNIFISLLFLIHSLHFKYFLDFATVYEARYVHLLLGPAVDSVFSLINKEVLFILDLPLLPFLALRLKKIQPAASSNRVSIAFFLFLLSVPLVSFPLGLNRILPEDYLKNVFSREAIVRIFGFLNYQALDTYIFVTTELSKGDVTQEEIGQVSAWFKQRRDRQRHRNSLTGIGQRMNLIVIQVESLQGFVIGKALHGNTITPNLNKLVGKSTYYTRIYDQVGLGGSSDATFLANCSLYPSRKGAVSFRYFQNSFDSLPKILEEQGYSTATMHNNWKGFWNSDQFERSIGFTHQFYADAYELDEKIGWGLSDRSFFVQSTNKIMGLPRPFYAFLRNLSSHKPFSYITAGDDGFPLGEFENTSMGNYIRSMHYVDTTIGEFMDMLSRQGVLQNTVVVIYGDHRAHLTRSDLASFNVDPEEDGRKIPLILIVPGNHTKGKGNTIGGLIDVTPTVLNILGVETSNRYFEGKDLNGKESYVVFRSGSFKGDPAESASRQLMISDLLIEKDMIPLLRQALAKKE